MRISFNRMEWAGSVGDLGALLPLAFAMIMINGLSATGLFLTVGLFYIIGGMYYRVPIAVQPMKVVAAYAIAQALSPEVITASGMMIAVLLFFLGLTGIVSQASKVIPLSVIRGVQLSTGILLVLKGIALAVGNSSFQAARGAVEPFLSFQRIGPVPLSLAIGIFFAAVTLALIKSKRFPAGLVVVGSGAVLGLFLGAWKVLVDLSLGFHLPEILPFGFPSGEAFSFALLALVLPQVPMTLGNAVIANKDLSFEYFGDESRRVTDRALCISMGLANMFSAFVGGMPVCHGAGGLAAHYRFGARTNGSNLIVGGIFVLLAIGFGSESIKVLHLIPMGVLGVLLVFAGWQLVLTVRSLRAKVDIAVVIVMLGITLTTNLAWAFGAGIILSLLLQKLKVSS
ncbi:putative sulfate/molybdate transporter [Maridesulfovibrio hydrothermalis]|uniref:Sulphate transporter n=1 Tax=Maridesulfovibrio hydrothermalis AM13 = DSM 14728 TaxID=1121451 RepID=L0RIV6_9BACT|nr:putative sulfate/molybdate transporter [Maridesulfovibrio hydrothermalis]CCO25511.1 Sulphate transporter [Maridesulfovibrio hydrothermalis AM13 = DSM 14728]